MGYLYLYSFYSIIQVRGKNKPNGWFPGNHVKLMQKASKGGGSGDVKDAPLSTFERTASISQQPAEDIYSVPAKKGMLVMSMIS